MNTSLLHCLSNLSMEGNRRIADLCGVYSETNSKQSLMREVYGRMTDPAYLRKALGELDADERMTLDYLVRHLHKHPEEVGGASALVHGLLGTRTGRADRVLQSLVGKAFLFQTAQQSVPVFPADLVEKLHALVGSIEDEAVRAMTGEPETLFAANFFLAHDLVGFLATVRKSTVRLTQGGAVFRRQREAMEAQRAVRRELSPFPDDWPHLQHPRGLEFLLFYTQTRALVQRDERRIVPREEAFSTLRGRRTAEVAAALLSFVEQHFVREYLHLQLALVALREGQAAQWYNLPALVEHLVTTHARSRWSVEQVRIDVYWLLSILHEIGVLDLGRFDGKDWGWRVSPLGRALLSGQPPPAEGREPCDIHVLPDFTVLVPFQIEADERWQLESFADLENADAIFTYRISRQSIYHALKEGVEVDSILAFMHQHGERDLPQNVAYSIREWASSFGRIHFADVLLLRCDSEELAAEVSASADIRHYIEGQITPRDLLVSRAGYEEIVKYLERMGHLPRPLRKS